jgi:hypothetical protein
MNWSASNILCVISIALAVAALIRPQWPLAAVAVLLLSVAVLIR